MNYELTELEIDKLDFINRVVTLVGVPCNDTLVIYDDNMGEILESNNFEPTDEVCYAYEYLDLDIEKSQAEQQSILDNAEKSYVFTHQWVKKLQVDRKILQFFYDNNRPTNKDNYEIFANENDLDDFSIDKINLRDFE